VANFRSGNTIFINDSSGATFPLKNVKVMYITIRTGSGGGGAIILEDLASSGAIKFIAAINGANDSKHFDFSQAPLVFTGGIKASTATTDTILVIKDGAA
jgi:hypothetical protein